MTKKRKTWLISWALVVILVNIVQQVNVVNNYFYKGSKNVLKHIFSFGFFAIILFLIGCASNAKTAGSGEDQLDLAIREATSYLNGQVPKGNKLAIINITSNYQALSEYIVSELNANIVNNSIFSLVDRQQLDVIRAEQNFQMSGEVSDESAQSIGQMLGAQTIITGSIRQIGQQWRIQLRALEVQSATVQGQYNKNIASIGIIVDLTSGSEVTGVPSSGSSSAGSVTYSENSKPSTSVALSQTYEIGDTGPAGGTVFYDKGNHTGDWRYLEYAPEIFRSVYWGPYDLNVSGTETGIGSGKNNTELIVRILTRRGEKGMAAQLCNNYIQNGYNDWFLPSKDELELLYTYLEENRLLDSRYGFYGWFFSSSQYGNTGAWGHNFTNGYQGEYRKNISGGLICAIRAF